MFRDVHLLRCERRLIKVSHCANTHPCKTLCEHYFRHSVYKEAHLAMPHYETLQMWHTYSTFVCVLVKTSAVMWWHVCASRFFLSLDHRRSIQKQMWELDTNSIWAWPILRRHNTIRCYTWTWVPLVMLWKYTSMFLDSLQKKKCAVQTFIFVIQNDSMYSVTSVKPH